MAADEKLTILIRCPGHRAIPFRRGQQLKIGRHRTNDIVVNDGTVSRFHATLVWQDHEDRPYIEDHNSANGTEVDGEPVEGRAPLTGDNHLTVGEFPITLELKGRRATRRGDRSSAKLDADESESTALIEAPSSVRLFSEAGDEFEGRFGSLKDLQRVLVRIEDDKRTGTLTLRIGARTWAVTYSQGLIVTAKRGAVSGFAAVREFLLRDADGTFKFALDLEPSEVNLSLSVKFLLSAGVDATAVHRKGGG